MQTDMTVGKPMKMLLNFTIPVFLGNVFQQLYSMADAVIVGKFVGTKGLAAVGATGTITFLIIGFPVSYTHLTLPTTPYVIPDGGYNRSYSSYLSEVRSRKNG